MTWEVFLTPHTDDESIGMAGAITRAHLAGARTSVVLVTDNLPSTRATRQFPQHDNLGYLRRVEWRKAMVCLCVDELQEWELSEAAMIEDPLRVQMEIERRLSALFKERIVSRVHTVIGKEDIHAEVGYGALAHEVCARAVRWCDTISVLHGVYVYSKDQAQRKRIGDLRVTPVLLSPKEHSRKKDALACYRAGEDTIGYGYMSVPELIDGAAADVFEYTVEVR
jgi:LmbE family N-acetylglucosaminyl deacetylase